MRNRTATAVACLLGAFFVGGTVSPSVAQVRHADELRYPPLPAFEIPQPERVELANGLVVLLLEDHQLPLVQAVALIKAGGVYDPVGQVGMSQLAAQVLRGGGAGDRDADQLDDYLEAKAAAIEISSTASTLRASLDCLAEDFGELLGTFADVLRRPRLPEDRLEQAKTYLNAGIARQNDNPNGILQRELAEVVYGDGSPWARTPTYAAVASIRREDLAAWQQRRITPERTVLGVVGDFDRKQALAAIRQAFGDWSRGEAGRDQLPAEGDGPRPGVYAIERPELNQSYLGLGALGIRRDDPDYFTLEVMNQLFGGAFSSRLFSTVRSKKGLSYSVFGAVASTYDHRGMTVVLMSTKAETTGAGIAALLDEVRGMTTNPPTEAEVAEAKAAILNAFIFNSDSPSKTLFQQLSYELYGYPRDWLSRYRAGVEAVTVEQVREAARRHLRADELAIVVVGPRQGLDRPWSDFGTVTLRDVSIPEPPGSP